MSQIWNVGWLTSRKTDGFPTTFQNGLPGDRTTVVARIGNDQAGHLPLRKVRYLRWIKAIVPTLMVCAGIAAVTSSKPISETPTQVSAQRIQSSDLVADLDERLHLMRVSRASSRFVDASASTTTMLPPPPVKATPPPTTAQPKSSPPTTSVQKKATVSETENSPGDIWTKLAHCESGMHQRATSKSGTYLGYFQFSMATWRSIGGPGDPRDHDYGTQLAYAQKLQARSGWGQWPHCSRRLGLR